MARRRLAVVANESAGNTLGEAIGDFMAGVKAQGTSPRTYRYYSDVLTKTFLPWCVERRIQELERLDQRALDEFSAYLLDRPDKPLAKSSAASYLRAVRTFVRWVGENGLSSADIRVRNVKVPRQVVDALSPAEISALEAAADTERDRLIIRVLANTGIRLSELLGLRVDDIRSEGARWYLRIEGRSYGGGAKGDRGRLVPLTPPELGRRLRRFATKGRRPEAYSDRLFLLLRRSRKTGTYEPLAESGVQQMLLTVAERAGIWSPADRTTGQSESGKRVHPHLFRHSFVTNALKRGVNPVIVQQIAGHRDLSMIATVYAHVNAMDGYDALMRSLTVESI